jgi:chromatin structure-remodeling complex subunit RSC1/2
MAEADTDAQMTDAPAEEDTIVVQHQPQTSQVVESIEVEPAAKLETADDAELGDNAETAENADEVNDEDAEGESDAGEEDQQDERRTKRPVSNNQYRALKAITETLTDFKIKKGSEDYYPSMLFKRVPNKRNLPDYYQIIKEPSAISTLKGKIQRKSYTGIPEFVRDFALVVHNAQVYNRPNSQPVRDVFQLEAVFREELRKLVEQGLLKEEETVFPDLGEIPAATPEPDPVSEEEEDDEDGEGEDDDEDDDGDDSDDGRRKRRRGRPSGGRKGRDDDDDDDKGNRKRRGRPPKVDTPLEARIKAIIKGLRRPKDKAGVYRLRHFERLPDKAEHPHYYQEIKEPMAMDIIKKKAKRKKYSSLETFTRDVELMFRNAMAYNVDSSDIYQDAKVLLGEAQDLSAAEKAKPDEEYLLDDGRIPLPNGVEYKGEFWKIGDWIHIQNPNDVTKPVVAQIYRTWRDAEGQNWINACWYYRPEQTVHQYEKHFYPNEVVKTGQYRDHHMEEVIDRCFVMFFTRYNRGRPRNLDPSKEVYVCEARYNEEKHKFNKIKTWASCLPDEVRDKDYEMDLFDAPRRIKKIPSPLKHLIKEDAKEDEDIPTPQWRNKNAPPLVGGIYKAPRDENVSQPNALDLSMLTAASAISSARSYTSAATNSHRCTCAADNKSRAPTPPESTQPSNRCEPVAAPAAKSLSRVSIYYTSTNKPCECLSFTCPAVRTSADIPPDGPSELLRARAGDAASPCTAIRTVRRSAAATSNNIPTWLCNNVCYSSLP